MDSASSVGGSQVQYPVHTGTWINWSRGPVFGATLTVERGDGYLLIAFTAYFIGVVATRFWRIVCLALHRVYSNPGPQDGLHHQRQAILRNSETPESAIWIFGQMYRGWRGSTQRPLLRTLPAFLAALFCVCAFTAASGFSALMSTDSDDEVLLDGSKCGLIDEDGLYKAAFDDKDGLVGVHNPKIINNALNYAQQCYSLNASSSNIFECGSFVVDQLPRTAKDNAPCPFKDGICRNDMSNLLLDTGLISSHEHLGINTPVDERILFRQVYHCAPLRTTGYTSDVTGQNENYTRYQYGPALLGSGSNKTSLDYTFEVRSLASQYSNQDDNPQRREGINFLLVNARSVFRNGEVENSSSTFIPIPELQRTDADVDIFFLVGNGVSFWKQTPDDWYRATIPTAASRFDDPASAYQPEEAASPMGCAQQFQVCNAALPPQSQCGPLAGWYDAIQGAAPLFNVTQDEMESNTIAKDKNGSKFLWFLNYCSNMARSPVRLAQGMGATALPSQRNFQDGLQGPLSDNQWKVDMTHLWTIWLASLQIGFAAAAIGLQAPELEPYLQTPGDLYQYDMCSNQKVKSTAHMSFSLFGLLFIFVVGSLIIIISYILGPILDGLERQRRYDMYKLLEWKTNETLYLQSHGFQSQGRGTWSHKDAPVPVTKPGERFKYLATLENFAIGRKGDEEKSMASTRSSSSDEGRRSQDSPGQEGKRDVPGSPRATPARGKGQSSESALDVEATK